MFEKIFSEAPDSTFVELSVGVDHRSFIKTGNFVEKCEVMFGKDKTDIYFAPALRKSEGGKKEDVYGSRVIWADFDGSVQPRPTFPPTYIVKSGGGYHFYWLLDKYETDISKIESANKVVMDDIAADACWNVNRILRYPGTINSKYPAPCVLASANEEIVYSVDDFCVLEKIGPKLKHKIRTGDSRGYRSRSERDWAIITEMIRDGADDELIRRIFQFQPCGDKSRESVTYLDHTLKSARGSNLLAGVSTEGDEASTVSPKAKRGRPPKKVINDDNFLIGDIIESEDGYLIERKGGPARLSTFVMDPKLLLESDEEGGEDAIVCDVISGGITWEGVTFLRSSFNDRHSLDKRLILGVWSWLGKDDDVRNLLPYLMKKLEYMGMPKAKSTHTLGRHGDLWVGTTQTIRQDCVFETKDAPMMYLSSGREPPMVEYAQPLGDEKIDIVQLLHINDPKVIWPTIGWFMATPYKTILESMKIRFPILNVYGTRGSGKTTLIKTMQRMLGYKHPITYDCSTTRFVTLTLMSSTNAIPIAFSEFRYSAGPNVERFLRTILLAYDVGKDPRGRANQTIQDYSLSAPFSVDGEDIIADPAAKERIVPVTLHPETIMEGKDCYEQFKSVWAMPLESFALPYIQYTLNANVHRMLRDATEAVHAAFPFVLPDRIRSNMIVATLGMISFAEFNNVEMPLIKDVLDESLASVYSVSMGRSSAIVDEFAEAIVNEVARDKAQFFSAIEKGGLVIWFQLSTSFNWWMRQRRMAGQSALERDAIRGQLHERIIHDSDVIGADDRGQYVLAPKIVSNYWCYGINLEKASKSGLDVPDKIILRTIKITY